MRIPSLTPSADLLRTVLAGAVGAVLATAVLAGPPAIAKAGDQVTSAMIKNGTIKKSDLNGTLKTSLGKADTALQSVPTTSVGTAEVKDRSLTAVDLSTASGSVLVDFDNLGTSFCQASNAVETGTDLTDDLILVSNAPTVAGSIQLEGRQSLSSPSKLEIVACNIGGAFNPPPATFSWMVFED